MTDGDRPDLQKLAMFDIIHAPRPWKFPDATPKESAVTDLKRRVRNLIADLENRPDLIYPPGPDWDPVRDHWFNCGQDEAYDNVIDWLYNILGEER